MAYVVDASVYTPLIATCGRGLLDAIKEAGFILLDLTLYETCNAFWKEHMKLHRITREEAVRACIASNVLARYAKLYRVTDLDAEDVISIAVENNITFYDAAYVALAKMLGTPVASEDSDILASAPRYGVKVVRLNKFMDTLGVC